MSQSSLTAIQTGVAVSPDDATAIWDALDTYMANFRMPIADYIDKHLETLLFPHVRIASHQVAVFPDAKSYKDLSVNHIDDYFQSGWDHSEWTKRTIVQADKEKVHVAVTFNRYRNDNSLINPEDSFYILEKDGGRWGVRGRSSFAK